MTLADLFHAVNLAGVRLANVNGQLQLRGTTIPADVKAGAAEHKDTLLALLPALPEPTPAPPAEQLPLSLFVRNPSAENGAADPEAGELATPEPTPDVLAEALANWDRIVDRDAAVQPGEDLLAVWRQLQVGTASSRLGPFCRRKEHRCGWRFGTGPADVRCADCYPPARPELVKQWEWVPDAEGVAALLQLAESTE